MLTLFGLALIGASVMGVSLAALSHDIGNHLPRDRRGR